MLGDFIKLKRTEKKLTLKDLAQLCNTSDATLSRIEMGKNEPDFTLLISLSKNLDFTLNELATATGFSTPPSESSPPLEQIIEKTVEKTAFKVSKETIEQLRAEYLTFLPVEEELSRLVKKGKQMEEMEKEGLPPGAIRMKLSTAKLPLVTGVKCGNFICPAEETYEMISVPESWGEVADFVIQVSGNSMEQYYIADGFYVAIKKQNTCSPGDIVLICDYDETDISKGVLKKAKSVNGIGLVFQNGTGDIIPMSESYRIEGIAVKWGML